MAHLIRYVKSGRVGFTIANLPMPDGTYRSYKEFGRDALRNILALWNAERMEMRAKKLLEDYEG